MDLLNKLLGHKRDNSGAVSNRPPAKRKDSSSKGKEVEFIREIVEQLVDNVPQKSEAVRRESNTGSSLSSTECFTDLLQVEDSRKSQETETDITEYESAADTDFSDKLPSSASLLTFSEQLLHDIENGSSPSSPVIPEPVENLHRLDLKDNDLVEASCVTKTVSYDIEEKTEAETFSVTKLSPLTSQSREQLALPIIDNSSVILKPEESNFSSTLPISNDLSAEFVNPDITFNVCSTSENELNELELPCKEESFDRNHVEQSSSISTGSESVNKYSTAVAPLDAVISPTDVQQETNVIAPSSKEESFSNVLSGKDIDLFTNLEGENKYVTLDKYPNLNVVNTRSESDVIACHAESISSKVTSDTLIKELPEKLLEHFSTVESGDQVIDEHQIVLDLDCTETVPGSDHSFDSTEIITDVVSEDFSFVSQEASKVAQEIFDAFETLDDIDEDSASLKMSSASNLVSQEKDLNMKASEATNSINDDFYHDDSIRSTHKLNNSPQPKLVKEDDAFGSLPETEKNAKTCDTVRAAEASKMKDGSAALRTAPSGTVGKDAVSYDILSTKGNAKPGHDIRRGLMQSEPEKPLCEDSVCLKGAIDENDNSRKSTEERKQTSVKNQALEFINKLLSQSALLKLSTSNNGNQTTQKGADNSVSDLPCNEGQLIQEQLLQLRDVIYEQDAVYKEELKKCQSRMKNVEEREHQLARRMSENSLGQQQMSLILEEYEKTISRLVAEKEHERQAFDMEKENLIKEKDTISGHLSNIEIAFSDVHQKYEKSKQVIQGFKNNEEALRATVSEYEAALKKQEQKYEILKSHAMSQLESANQELIAMRRNHEAENSKLKAMLKKAEIKIHSLEETLQQKVKENQELVNICDELIGKVGSSE